MDMVIICAFLLCSYEATSSRKNRSLSKELTTGAVASVFLVRQQIVSRFWLILLMGDNNSSVYLQGFGSLFLLLSSGVYV